MLHANAEDMLAYQMIMPALPSQEGVQSTEMPPTT